MSEIQVTLPDGSVKNYSSGITPMEIAKNISHGLAKQVLSAKVNDKVVDTNTTLTENCSLQLLTWNDDEGKSTFWHSSAHLLAEALEALYPGVKLGIGPPIENGFYYDIDAGENTLSTEDFEKIEKKMVGNPFQKKTPLITSKKREMNIN
jgi:threonyl-tRNA synthetase